ncbi:actin-binding protein IPP-like [Lingula anatina]|uniref:Actin-binding protein IPP-like n=1 Tax=Lingula anatina TaxID=7574 RepID=A0A1S3IX72_LINAN|nr:actin-binding protein IPP-like [Lingula anatina]|eukprot:XP_013402638.1 actin-binding protein IPP-like [Lingula anatina]
MSDLGTEMKTVERYNPATNEWTKLASMKEKRAYIGVTVLDEYIYAVGGWNEHHGALKTVERYYPRKNEWTSLPTMSEPRAGASVAAVNGLVFVIGGRTSSNEFTAPATLDTVECFDPHTWTWIEIGKMPTSRCEAGIAVL